MINRKISQIIEKNAISLEYLGFGSPLRKKSSSENENSHDNNESPTKMLEKSILKKQNKFDSECNFMESDKRNLMNYDTKNTLTDLTKKVENNSFLVSLNEIVRKKSASISYFGLKSRTSLSPLKNLIPVIDSFKKKQISVEELKHRYEILVEEFKFKHWTQRNFIFFDLFRQFIFLCFVVFLHPHSFLQILLINISHWLYLLATLYIRPFNPFFSKINFAVTEIFLSLALLSCLAIGIYDYNKFEKIEERIKLGRVVPFCNLGLLYWVFITVVYKLICKLIHACRGHNPVHVIKD